MHPCNLIYNTSGSGTIYGTVPGVCRITGETSEGLPFHKWVRDTFTDHAWLKPGNIISNQAMFCFDEQSTFLQLKNGRERPQRFRTYSHIIDKSGVWHTLTKADKKLTYKLIIDGATLVCLTDSGQKHLLFKHRTGMWQLDDIFIIPDIPLLIKLHSTMMQLITAGFSQTEIITGNYLQYRILKAGIGTWKSFEDLLRPLRSSKFFTFTAWLLYSIQSENINE